MALQQQVAGAAPEEVLVLEVAGGVEDFLVAVKNTPGMEWLAESDDFELPADEDFGANDSHPDDDFNARLYLVMANQQAVEELRRLWARYLQEIEEPGDRWPKGRTKWRDLFDRLRDLRFWDVQDRLAETGLVEDWRERVAQGAERIPVETELWYRPEVGARAAAENEVRQAIGRDGGEVVGRCDIPEIGYHAILAEVPIRTAEQLIENSDVQLVRSRRVMFLRPVGQLSTPRGDDELTALGDDNKEDLPSGSPVVALLDGLPMANHLLLDGRVIIDDPDGWAAGYQAQEQRHGTAMASIIARGDAGHLDVPLPTPLYARLIMKPNPNHLQRDEGIPEDHLAVDLLHRAVRRMLDSNDERVAPTVRIINLSVCDRERPFLRDMSALARLLDWTAWEYNLLWVVSAGNRTQQINLDVSPADASQLSPGERSRAVFTSLWQDSNNRRLLSPAESVNGVTAGATHGDASGATLAAEFDTFPSDDDYPSPVNPLGLGYRAAVKPELLAPGGRQPYRRPQIIEPPVALEMVETNRAPGIQVATPGSTAGDLRATQFTRGTSNAAAMVSRLAGRIYGVLEEVPAATSGVPEEHRTVVTKALVVHSTRWSECRSEIVDVVGSRRARERVPRFIGYGAVDVSRAISATDQRATLIGWGTLAEDESDLYSVPLPPSLSAVHCLRRLVLTLAWLSPIAPTTRKYRVASLRLDADGEGWKPIAVDRKEADNRIVMRGTVQHEVLEGHRAAAFVDGDNIRIRVSCASDASSLSEAIPYGLAVTLEVAEEIDIPIYEEIENRIQVLVRVPLQG